MDHTKIKNIKEKLIVAQSDASNIEKENILTMIEGNQDYTLDLDGTFFMKYILETELNKRGTDQENADIYKSEVLYIKILMARSLMKQRILKNNKYNTAQYNDTLVNFMLASRKNKEDGKTV